MLKWFVDLFFETEEVVVEEHDEDISPKPTTVKSSQPVLDKTSSVKQVAKPITVIDDEKEKTKVVDEPVKEEKRSIFINENPTIDTSKEEIIKEKIKEETKVIEDDYQFTPIISPIFGVDEKHQPQKAKKTTIKPVIDNTSAIGTIISPIYGLEIQRSPFFIRTNDRMAKDPEFKIDLKQMFTEETPVADPDEDTDLFDQDLTETDVPDIDQVNADQETADLDEQIVTSEDVDVLSESEAKKSDNRDVSEEDKFLEDQQPSLFDYLR